MISNPFSRISSSGQLYVLMLTSSRTEIYFVNRSGATLIALPSGMPKPTDAVNLVIQKPEMPWVILVDQSEESFWGGTMPPLRGAAKDAWINRMADQSGAESPYRWSEIQGKSRSHEGQLRVLGYTLGQPEALTPWLEALKTANARIRGVYAPVMLTLLALDVLKIKVEKSDQDIQVLVTPHPDGLRQTVLVGGRVRFSRLALRPQTEGMHWYVAVYEETLRLREYLLGNGLLKNDRAGMTIQCVKPLSAQGIEPVTGVQPHTKDRYHWIDYPQPSLVYLTAIAKHQSWHQLVPPIYRKRDLSVQGAHALLIAAALLLGLGLAYLTYEGMRLWEKQNAIQLATQEANAANQRYQTIAKTFPQTPLTSLQLIDMDGRWKSMQAKTPPNMIPVLKIAGQVLERHPLMLVDELFWVADITVSGDATDPLGHSLNNAAPLPIMPGTSMSTTPEDAEKNKKEVTALTLRGTIRGVASDDLRGTRDAMSQLEADFGKQPSIRVEVTKRPLDLSAKAALNGSGIQDKSELNFEMKLWQR